MNGISPKAMDGHPITEFVFVVFDVSFPSPISRFIVPPIVANLFREDSQFHFEIESDDCELIFEGVTSMEPDGFELERTVSPGERLKVHMELEASQTVKKPIVLAASSRRL
jgi:hypothetical protein